MEEENIIGLCIDLEYDDLDVPVEGEFGGGPIYDGAPMGSPIRYAKEYSACGTIDHWTYPHDITEEDVIEYIQKVLKVEPTQELINQVTEDDIYEFLLDKYMDEAIDDAAANWDYDEVNWDDPDDYDPRCEPEYYDD